MNFRFHSKKKNSKPRHRIIITRQMTDKDISAEELETFHKQLTTNPEFKKLFFDYMKEINDPATKKANEEYLLQLESQGQIAKGQKLCKPTAGYCIRASGKVKQKSGKLEMKSIYVNICFSEHIKDYEQKPTKGGLTLSVPNSVGVSRLTQDDESKSTRADMEVLEVVFGIKTITAALLDERLQQAVNDVAVDAAIKRLQWQPFSNRKINIIKNQTFKGGDDPGMMMLQIDGLKEENKNNIASSTPISHEHLINHDINTMPNTNTATSTTTVTTKNSNKLSKGQKKRMQKNKKAFESAISNDKKNNKNVLISEIDDDDNNNPNIHKKEQKPQYNIIHKGNMIISDFEKNISGNPLDLVNIQQGMQNRPKQLCVRVKLPLCTSAANCELDVSKDQFRMIVPEVYRLEIKLPYSVDSEDKSMKAKFNSKTHTLEVILNVLECSIEELKEMEKQFREVRERQENMRMNENIITEDIDEYVIVSVDDNKKNEKKKVEKIKHEKKNNNKKNNNTIDNAIDNTIDNDDTKKVRSSSMKQSRISDNNNNNINDTTKTKKKRSVSFSLRTGRNGHTTIVLPGDDSELPYELTEKEKRLKRTQHKNARKKERKRLLQANGGVYNSKEFHKDSSEGRAPVFHYSESSNTLQVVINLKGVRECDTSIVFKPNEIICNFISNDKKYYLKLGPLTGEILPEKCTYVLNPKNVILTLHKAADILWIFLEECEAIGDSDSTPVASPILLSYMPRKANGELITELNLPTQVKMKKSSLSPNDNNVDKKKNNIIDLFMEKNAPSTTRIVDNITIEKQQQQEEEHEPFVPMKDISLPSFIDNTITTNNHTVIDNNMISDDFLFELD